jgi:Domain of unknown function (DUF4166)
MTPLYRRLLGPRFDALPACVRALHDLGGTSVWRGRGDVERGAAPLSRLVAAIAALPPTGADQPLRVTFTAAASRELWSRQFGCRYFRTIQYERHGLLYERVGPSVLAFTPIASAEGLVLRLDGFKVLGLPLPRVMHPRVRTFECEAGGRYHFEVEVTLPGVGLLVRYGGWLAPEPDGP